MALQLFQAQAERIRDLTHDVREIGFRLLAPTEIDFKAGQFVSFEVLHPTFNRPVTRHYSIASPPSQRDSVTLLLNLIPGGPGSTYLFSLKEGDHTQFKGPTGAFYLRDDATRDPLFVEKVRDIVGLYLAPPRRAAQSARAMHRAARRWQQLPPVRVCSDPPP